MLRNPDPAATIPWEVNPPQPMEGGQKTGTPATSARNADNSSDRFQDPGWNSLAWDSELRTTNGPNAGLNPFNGR